MKTNNYNLQILHHEAVFATRELALTYLMDFYKPNSLDAEPILVKYGDTRNPDVILAFGTSSEAPGSFYAIDMTKANEEIETLIEQMSGSEEEIENLTARLTEIINATGLDFDDNKIIDKITYKPDANDPVINTATTLAQAIDLLSKYAQENFANNELSVEETNSVNLSLTDKPTGGKLLKADVNISEADSDNVNFNNNIIGIKSDGLYAASHLAYDDVRHQLIFTTSGVKNGRFQDDAIVERIDLGEHTKLLADNDGKNVKLTITENSENYTATLSAEAQISSNEDNILENREGKLAVLGRASNIKYNNITVDEELTSQREMLRELDTEVQNAAKTAHIEGGVTDTFETTVTTLSDGGSKITGAVRLGSNNSIMISNGGLEANISVDVDNISNSLIVRIGNTTVTKPLPGVELFESAEYNDANEELIITFRTGKTLVIPIHSLINTWDTLNNTESPIVLTKTVVSGGSDTISGDIKLRSTDNLIGKDNGQLFVSESNIDNKINAEATRATTAENALQTAINTLSDSVDTRFNTQSESITDIAESVANERERAMGVEATISGVANHADEIAQEAKGMAQDLQTSVATLSNDLTAAETDLSNLAQTVADNKTETNAKFAETNTNVAANTSAISDLTSDLADEVAARTNADTVLDGKITNLTTSLTAEVNRAGAAETVLDGKITALEESMSGGAAETLQAAKDYTDTKVLAEKTAREAKETQIEGEIADTLREAKAYTDEKVATKANAADVYTKTEIDNKGFLTEHQDISGLAEKFTLSETDTVRMTMTNANVLSSDVKIKTLSGGETNIIKSDGNGVFATVTLTYDAATNTLTFNDGNGSRQIQLTGATLLEGAEYDATNKLIILHVKNGSVTSDVTIPVSDLVDTWTVDNTGNSPVVLTKTEGSDGDVLSATLSILNNENNLLVDNNGSLFVDGRAESHSALFGGVQTSVQGAINMLKERTDEISRIEEDIDNLKDDVRDLNTEVSTLSASVSGFNSRIATLETTVGGFNNRITTLESSVSSMSTAIQELQEEIGGGSGSGSISDRISALEDAIADLIDFGHTTQG